MSELYAPPPAYNEICNTSTSSIADPEWQAWYKELQALNFTQEETNEYTKLFVNNDMDISMIPELSDAILRTMGIDKAGHRIRILRLQNNASNVTTTRSINAISQVVNSPQCAWHPNALAIAKCYRCRRYVCLLCRRKGPVDGTQRSVCHMCYSECTIL
ncbi:unnamed protein product [Rotaria magnacalcarata]